MGKEVLKIAAGIVLAGLIVWAFKYAMDKLKAMPKTVPTADPNLNTGTPTDDDVSDTSGGATRSAMRATA